MERFDTGDPDEYYIVCGDCDGEKSRFVIFDPEEPAEWVVCPDCDGDGIISADPEDFE